MGVAGLAQWSRSPSRQEAGSSATSGPAPGKGAHSGEEEGQGEPGEDGEARTAVGVSGDIDPDTEISARSKQENASEELGQGRLDGPVPRRPTSDGPRAIRASQHYSFFETPVRLESLRELTGG